MPAAAALALFAMLGCHDDSLPSSRAVTASPSRETIDSLRCLGRYQSALATARARERALDRIPGAPGWMRDDSRRDIATLARIAACPDSVRAAFAVADAATARADSLEAAGDSRAAMETTRAQLATRRRLLGPEHPEIAASMSALARLTLDYADALAAYQLDLGALEDEVNLLDIALFELYLSKRGGDLTKRQ